MKLRKSQLREIIRQEVRSTAENRDTVDSITLNIPLFLRLLEYAKEDAKTDLDLHDVTENATRLGVNGKVLTMKDYQLITFKWKRDS